jgi:hypothetical protein
VNEKLDMCRRHSINTRNFLNEPQTKQKKNELVFGQKKISSNLPRNEYLKTRNESIVMLKNNKKNPPWKLQNFP